MSPAFLGFIRGIGFAVLVAILTFVGNAANLSGVLNPATASLIAALALAIEHAIQGSTGNALFGMVKAR